MNVFFLLFLFLRFQYGRQKWRESVLRKVANRLHRYPMGQKFHRNRSISHRFRDKCVFAFNAEIQDGHQKWWENNF